MSKKSKVKNSNKTKPSEPIVPPTSQKSTDFNPDYSYVIKDLKRIGLLAGIFFSILVILTFVLK